METMLYFCNYFLNAFISKSQVNNLIIKVKAAAI